jgi:hypothetical protein
VLSLPFVVTILALAGILAHFGIIRRLLKAPMLAQVCGTFGLGVAAATPSRAYVFRRSKGHFQPSKRQSRTERSKPSSCCGVNPGNATSSGRA